MSEPSAPPPEVVELATERDEKRADKDFEAADLLRERIRELGYEVVDTPEGGVLEPVVATHHRLSPAFVESVLEAPTNVDFSIQWIVQGWPEDVVRGVEAFRRFGSGLSVQHVIVDCVDTNSADLPSGSDVEVVALENDFGWGVGRNAGLRRAAGEIVVVIDSSIEPAGDVLSPLAAVLEDPACGIAGPLGIVTDDLRNFKDSQGVGPRHLVDAVEGYFMAFRRESIVPAGFFDEKFKFYRTADIDFSFRIKDLGLDARIVPVLVERHEHRMWANTDEAERDRLSKRNFYRFLERWRDRTDLIVAASEGE